MIFNNKKASFLSEIAFKNIKNSSKKLQVQTNDIVKILVCPFWVLAYRLQYSSRREPSNDITFVWVESMVSDPLWARDGPLSGSGRIVLSGLEQSDYPFSPFLWDGNRTTLIRLFAVCCVSFWKFRIRCASLNALFMPVLSEEAGDTVFICVDSHRACHVTVRQHNKWNFHSPL